MFKKEFLSAGILVLFWSVSSFALEDHEVKIDDFRDASVIIIPKSATKIRYGVYLRDVSGTNKLGNPVMVDDVVIGGFHHRKDSEMVVDALIKEIKENGLIDSNECHIIPNLRYSSNETPLSAFTKDEGDRSMVKDGGINVIMGSEKFSFGHATWSTFEGCLFKTSNIPHKNSVRVEETITTKQRVTNLGKGLTKGVLGVTRSALGLAVGAAGGAVGGTLGGLNNGFEDGNKMVPIAGPNVISMVVMGAARGTMGACFGTCLGAYCGTQTGIGLLRSAGRDIKSAFTGKRNNPAPENNIPPPNTPFVSATPAVKPASASAKAQAV